MPPILSRGFGGRRRDEFPRDRVPPGQYVTPGFPVLSAGPPPHTPLDQWDFSIVGEVDEPRRWTWEEFRALPSEEVTRDIHCVTKWSKLDTVWQGVSVDTLLDGIETSAEYVVEYSDGGYTTNLPLEDVTGGKAWVAFLYGGEPPQPERGGNSGTGATELASRGRRRGRRRDGSRQDDRLRCPRLARAPRRPARGHSPDRRGRLSGRTQLLDRIGSGRQAPRPHRRPHSGRRGLAIHRGRAAARRPDRATRSCRRLLRLGAVAGRPAAARRGRIRYRAVDGDDPASRRRRKRHGHAAALLLARLGRRHLPGRARAAERQRSHGGAHADGLAAARLDGLRAPRRRRDAGGGRPEPCRAAACLRLRPDAVRGGRGRGAGTPGARPARNQDRALRTDWRLRWTQTH